MLVIGELLNTSREHIEPLVISRDKESIKKLAVLQVKAGANLVDVNAGTLVEGETEALTWLVKTVQEALEVPLCLDSANPKAIESALKVHKGKALINSISGEKKRFEEIVPLAKEYQASIIALCMDGRKIPDTPRARFEIGYKLVEELVKNGIPTADIYLDPLVRPISTGTKLANVVLETLKLIKQSMPEVKVVCGLSNVSYGLPRRHLINRTFLAMALEVGLDAAIVDPTDFELMATMYAAEALLDQDAYCKRYIAAHRDGFLG
ncbi:methyltetrahydrofolate cobalamin methyltransferase [Zhaonella formicivorans]|uniref:methyltetrahydrofolate cobalamin methyltransferase n=1 Tax=Zhaonella formicivorans TaxID=2528593 RepID=UPI0010E29053|nr:methyltetrahydrofolate cobalamin methyltransferase [Zhaonella formicivorans]